MPSLPLLPEELLVHQEAHVVDCVLAPMKDSKYYPEQRA